MTRPTRLAFTYAVVSTAWILGSDLLLGRLSGIPQSVTTVSLLKGFAFVGLTTALLYLLVARWAEEDLAEALRPGLMGPAIVLSGIALVAAAGTYHGVRSDQKLLREREVSILGSIAEARGRFLAQVLEERREPVHSLAVRLSRTPAPDAEVEASLAAFVGSHPRTVQGVSLFGEGCVPLHAAGRGPGDRPADLCKAATPAGEWFAGPPGTGSWALSMMVPGSPRTLVAAFHAAPISNLLTPVQYGTAEGRVRLERAGDHERNAPSLSARSGPVAGTDWIVVVEADESSLARSFDRHALTSAAGALLLVVGAGALLVLQWRARSGALARAAERADLEKVRAERDLAAERRRGEARYRTILETATEGIHIVDLDGRVVEVNPAFRSLLRLPDGPLSLTLPDFEAGISPERCREEVARRIENPGRFEARWKRRDGTLLDVEVSVTGVVIEGQTLLSCAGRDVTEQRKSEERNAELETRFREAQKMESIARLAGGVAHDFNNMLGVILGYSQLAESRLPEGSDVREHIQEIEKAAERSAELTRQLLAFARRQPIAPQPLDLSSSVQQMSKMLSRLVGEDVELRILVAPDLWKVHMDPSQVDQILVNLVVNARDATSRGGTITIETANETVPAGAGPGPVLAPGDYVALSVKDTGSGIDPEVLPHIFEPFFTTKPKGKGTGLGLATTYGIARQNLGAVDVRSEVGQGSVFRVRIPRLKDPVEAVPTAVATQAPKGTETILLVDDEDMLLRLMKGALESSGYHVLTAQDGASALQIARDLPGAIDLLVTDVVMPGLSGKELRQRLATLRPGVRCLYLSGYTADVIAHHGILDADVHLLQKPFSVARLAEKVREVLDGAVSGSAIPIVRR
ncbi:MAG: response regulator [Acidobacteria bacterium]|nr:response regulator [Acidobacteriota bacterium]